MLPKRQAMPFWMSMVYCAPRVGGLDQQAQLQRESGSLSYPRDYQWTQVGRQELSMAARPAEEKWTRTPTAKRVNFEANGTISAFYPLWKSLSNSDEAPEDDTRHLWLVKGSLLQSIVESADPPQYTLTQQTTKALSKRSIKPFGRLPSLSHAVVSVRIIACSGGLPETNAALYGLQNSDYSDATESAVRFFSCTQCVQSIRTDIGFSFCLGNPHPANWRGGRLGHKWWLLSRPRRRLRHRQPSV